MTKLAEQPVELDISGMTCASCAAHIEKKLNKIENVQASVNYATERAAVIAPPEVTMAQLIKAVQDAGYDATPAAAVKPPVDRLAKLRIRMIVSILVALPVMAMSMVPIWQFPGWQWVSLVLASVVVWWCGAGFHTATWANLKHGTTTMDTLISMGAIAAYLWSCYAMIFGRAGQIGMTHEFSFVLHRSDGLGNIYFEAAVGIITFLLIGRYIEARSKNEAGSALRALLELGAKDAVLLRDGAEVRVPIDQVRIGDEFVVRPGEKIATDGEVITGQSAIDATLITGESIPVEVGPGDSVIGGTLNTTGQVVVRASAIGADTQLSHIAKLIEQAQMGKANVQRLADKVSRIFVPAVIVIAVITLLCWLVSGAGAGFSFTSAVAVLIIACPCALGLATPTALLVGTGRGAQLGIVIRGPEILENARHIDTIVLDKTGTLTTGQMSVVRVVPAGIGADELQRIAAIVESGSEHPIARAIAASAPGGVVKNFENLPGRGVQGEVDGQLILAGNAALMTGIKGFVGSDCDTSVVYLAADGVYLGRIEVADTIKPTSKDAIKQFKSLGLHPVLLTGDRRSVAESVATQLGIEQVVADALPADKVKQVKQLQATGRKVAMVGDGVNDAAALTQADLGIAMGSGSDVAIAASDLTLMRPDLLLAADAIRLSRRTLRTIKQNLFWAFVYNAGAIPVAALGLLNPMFAGAAMAFSSVFVVFNSLRLRNFQSDEK